MEATFEYLLKANVILSILVAVFYLLFRKEKFLRTNRIVLSFIFLAVFLIPLCPQIFNFSIFESQLPQYGISIVPAHTADSVVQGTADRLFAPQKLYIVGMLIYIVITVVLLARLIMQNLRMGTVIRKSNQHKKNGIVYCTPTDEVPPCSFFNFIIVDQKSFEPDVYQHIVAHEQAHCRQLHSVDVILSELLCTLLWMNPLAYLYRKQLRLNLEFLADEQVIASGADRKVYQLSLLQHILGNASFGIANSFYASKVKQRVSMMNTEKPASGDRYKYLLLLPLLLVLYFVLARQTVGLSPLPTLTQETAPANTDSDLVMLKKETAHAMSSPTKSKRIVARVAVVEGKPGRSEIKPLAPVTASTLQEDERSSTMVTAKESNELQGVALDVKPVLRVQGYQIPAEQKPDLTLSNSGTPTNIKGKALESPNRSTPIVVQGYPIKPRPDPQK